jgi:hypothetical protein
VLENCAEKGEPNKAACESSRTAAEQFCPGTAHEPLAEPGYLCVYVESQFPSNGVKETMAVTPQKFGASFGAFGEAGTVVEPGTLVNGSWAVTAE